MSEEEVLEKLTGLLAKALQEASSASKPRQTSPLMLDPSDKLFNELDTIAQKLSDMNIKIQRISDMQTNDHQLLSEHDKILVRGTEKTPSLQETMRNMAKEQTDFINGIKTDREETKKKIEAEETAKKDTRNRWKWAWISLGFVTGPKLIWDIINFWITVVNPALHTIPPTITPTP